MNLLEYHGQHLGYRGICGRFLDLWRGRGFWRIEDSADTGERIREWPRDCVAGQNLELTLEIRSNCVQLVETPDALSRCTMHDNEVRKSEDVLNVEADRESAVALDGTGAVTVTRNRAPVDVRHGAQPYSWTLTTVKSLFLIAKISTLEMSTVDHFLLFFKQSCICSLVMVTGTSMNLTKEEGEASLFVQRRAVIVFLDTSGGAVWARKGIDVLAVVGRGGSVRALGRATLGWRRVVLKGRGATGVKGTGITVQLSILKRDDKTQESNPELVRIPKKTTKSSSKITKKITKSNMEDHRAGQEPSKYSNCQM
ncbi:hypothetical protein JOM56_010281 [Amanita muscaria]